MERLYVPSGWFADHDTNVVIEPDVDHQELLVNRLGSRNPTGRMECEVQVADKWRGLYNDWVESLIGTVVTARGVWVDDDGHDHRTELHPLDLIAGRVTRSMRADGDWISNLAEDRGLEIGVNLFAYRFAAASDTREGYFFDGPPLADITRATQVMLDFPPRPGHNWTPMVGSVVGTNSAEAEASAFDGGEDTQLRIWARCLAVGDGGPGAVLGEAVAYWKAPLSPDTHDDLDWQQRI